MDKKIEERENYLESLEKVYHDGTSHKFCGVAYVSFKTETEKNEVLYYNYVSRF